MEKDFEATRFRSSQAQNWRNRNHAVDKMFCGLSRLVRAKTREILKMLLVSEQRMTTQSVISVRYHRTRKRTFLNN